MQNKVAVLVSSCDKYADIWNAFFTLYKNNWDPDYPIYLNTESKEFYFDGLNIKAIHTENDLAWGARLIKVLEQIESDYIIFMLDDFFIRSKVLQDEIDNCILYLDQNPNVATFAFVPVCDEGNLEDNIFPGFKRRPVKCPYKLNTQAGIWRRRDLIRFIRPHESPWNFEIFGSKRASRYHELFYCRASNKPPIMDYWFGEAGGIRGGKWNREAYKFCQEQGIDLSASSRELRTDNEVKVSRFDYYVERLNLQTIVNALMIRWKSLKW